MKTKKFTFKTFENDTHYIKFKKVNVGLIEERSPHKIRLQVIKADIKNCKWKWIRLKKEFTSVDEAKKFLNDNIDAVMTCWRIYE